MSKQLYYKRLRRKGKKIPIPDVFAYKYHIKPHEFERSFHPEEIDDVGVLDANEFFLHPFVENLPYDQDEHGALWLRPFADETINEPPTRMSTKISTWRNNRKRQHQEEQLTKDQLDYEASFPSAETLLARQEKIKQNFEYDEKLLKEAELFDNTWPDDHDVSYHANQILANMDGTRKDHGYEPWYGYEEEREDDEYITLLNYHPSKGKSERSYYVRNAYTKPFDINDYKKPGRRNLAIWDKVKQQIEGIQEFLTPDKRGAYMQKMKPYIDTYQQFLEPALEKAKKDRIQTAHYNNQFDTYLKLKWQNAKMVRETMAQLEKEAALGLKPSEQIPWYKRSKQNLPPIYPKEGRIEEMPPDGNDYQAFNDNEPYQQPTIQDDSLLFQGEPPLERSIQSRRFNNRPTKRQKNDGYFEGGGSVNVVGEDLFIPDESLSTTFEGEINRIPSALSRKIFKNYQKVNKKYNNLNKYKYKNYDNNHNEDDTNIYQQNSAAFPFEYQNLNLPRFENDPNVENPALGSKFWDNLPVLEELEEEENLLPSLRTRKYDSFEGVNTDSIVTGLEKTFVQIPDFELRRDEQNAGIHKKTKAKISRDKKSNSSEGI